MSLGAAMAALAVFLLAVGFLLTAFGVGVDSGILAIVIGFLILHIRGKYNERMDASTE